jgi:DNA replication protein DnaC
VTSPEEPVTLPGELARQALVLLGTCEQVISALRARGLRRALALEDLEQLAALLTGGVQPGRPAGRRPARARRRRARRAGTVTAPAAPPLPAELDALVRRMRLPYLRKAAPDVLATARAQRWEPAEVLRVLLAEEVTGRDAATRRMRRKTAAFPSGKTFSSWRPEESSVPEATQNALATLEWIGRAENLVIAGPSGTGKSHLVEALAHAAIEKDLRVAWFTLETLTAAIGRAKADGSVARTVTRICRSDLVVVDDIGMLPAGQDAAEAFYRITDAAYERRSVAVTSNIHPSGFDTIMPKTLATATVDRLLHHAHLVITKGDSHRLAQALAGKGVIPLAT